MHRVLMVGLDGATFSILRPLAEAGRLPHLAKMLESGASGILHSTVPPITPTAWTTIFTGKNPGRHGLFDFQTIDPETYKRRTVQAGEHLEKPLWQLLSEVGIKSSVIDVPFTWPPRPFDGVMLTGYGTPRTPGTMLTHPADLAEQLPSELHSLVRVALPEQAFDRSEAFIEEWSAIMDGRERLLEAFAKKKDWRFFFTVFSITDNLAHLLWTYCEPTHSNYRHPDAEKYREAFFKAYERCDRLLGRLWEWAGPDCVTLAISDHGFGSIRPRQFIFQLLAEGGFILPRQGPSFGRVKGALQRTALRAYNAHPVIREFVKGMRPGSRARLKGALKRGGLVADGEEIDAERSSVIPSPFGLQLWINSQDRFPKGPVPESQKSEVLEQVVEQLKASKDPVTGRAVFKKIHRRGDVYSGSAEQRAPDLILEYEDVYNKGEEGKVLPMNPGLEGGHTGEGIFLASGPGVGSGEIQGMALEDLAPTILYLLGRPIPADMDGKVLEPIFDASYRKAHPIEFTEVEARWDVGESGSKSGYTPEQEAEITRQLEDLGYL